MTGTCTPFGFGSRSLDAAFFIEPCKNLNPDPREVSARLFQQVTQQLAAISNRSPLTPPTFDSFTPRHYHDAIRVNILWFLSLCISSLLRSRCYACATVDPQVP